MMWNERPSGTATASASRLASTTGTTTATERRGHGARSNHEAKPFTGDVYLRVEGIAALFAEVQAAGARMLEGYGVRPYGLAEFMVGDVDGRVRTFGGRPG